MKTTKVSMTEQVCYCGTIQIDSGHLETHSISLPNPWWFRGVILDTSWRWMKCSNFEKPQKRHNNTMQNHGVLHWVYSFPTSPRYGGAHLYPHWCHGCHGTDQQHSAALRVCLAPPNLFGPLVAKIFTKLGGWVRDHGGSPSSLTFLFRFIFHKPRILDFP